MQDWWSRFGGFGLIFGGWLLLTGLIPSAAGPADALRGLPLVAPPGPVAGAPQSPPRMIGSPRQGPLGRVVDPAPGAAPATAAPTPVPVTATAPPATPEAPAAVEPEPAPESAPEPAPEVPQEALAETAAVEVAPAPSTDRVVIPRIGVDTKVIDVGLRPSGEMDTAAYAAGRLSFSAQAGEAGNAIIAGHNDVEGEVFRRLPELRPGDEVRLHRGGQAFTYTVVVRTIVREEGASAQQRQENARWMDPTEGPTVTLITCYPYRVDTHRVIAHAVLTAGP